MSSKIKQNLLNELLISLAKYENINRYVVGGLIKNENREILLLKRAPNEFLPGLVELPSGKVEPNETLTEALVREIKEETNLDVKSIDEYLGHFDYKSKSNTSTRQFNFEIHVRDYSKLKISEEHESAYWIKENEIDEYNTSDNIRHLILH